MIILTLVQQFRSGITIASHAIGNIKEYQLLNAPFQLLALPIGYYFLYKGYPAYSIMLSIIFIEIIIVFLNILFFKKLTNYSPLIYIKDVLIACSFSFVLGFGINYLIHTYILYSFEDYLRVLLLFPLSIISYLILIYKLNLNNKEKEKLTTIIHKIKGKFC
jgi:hypothetical protein